MSLESFNPLTRDLVEPCDSLVKTDIMKNIKKKKVIRKTQSNEKKISPQLQSDTPSICYFGFTKESNHQNGTFNFPPLFVSMSNDEFY